MRGHRRPSAGSCSRLLAALAVGLGAVSLLAGFSDSFPVRLLQGLAVFAAGAVVLGGAVVFALVHLAGWREPGVRGRFDAIVERAERLAAEGRLGRRRRERDRPDDDDELFDVDRRRGLPRPRARRRSTTFRSSSTARWSTWRSSSPRAADAGRRRLRALPGRHGRPRLLPRPDRDLPRHADARLRPRPGAAQGSGHPDRAPRARPPSRVGRERRARPRAVDAAAPLRAIRTRRPQMPEAVIVDAIRTPIGRAGKGSLKTVRADELAALPIRTLIERNPDVDFAADRRRADGRRLGRRRAGLQRRPQRRRCWPDLTTTSRPAPSTASAPPR